MGTRMCQMYPWTMWLCFHVGRVTRFDGLTVQRFGDGVTSPFDRSVDAVFQRSSYPFFLPLHSALLRKTPSHRISAKNSEDHYQAHQNSMQATRLYLPPSLSPSLSPPHSPIPPPPPPPPPNTPTSQLPPSQPPSPARKTPSTPSTALSPLQTTPHCAGSPLR